MKTLIANGTLVFSDHRLKANLLVDGEQISYIGPDRPAADTTIDANGCYLMPGFIDTHTHLELSHGLFGQDTEAAAQGGCTSVLEFANQVRGDTMLHGFEKWMQYAKNSTTNYGFHMSLSEWNDRQLPQLDEMDRLGVTSYKMYMVYDGLKVDDGEIYAALKAIKQHGAILGVHCENWELLNRMADEVFQAGYHTAVGHPMSRPSPVEAEAISRFLRIAQLAEAPAYIVHLSTKEGLLEILRARERGQEVYVETCPQYLLLTDDAYATDEGVKYIMSPPLRKKADNEALWQALSDGAIDTIGTDHCSFFMAEKLEYAGDFRLVPNGCAGLQHRAQLIYTYGVCQERISLERMVALLSTNPARLFGIADRGELCTGKVADLVIWDPSYRGQITNTNHHHNCDNSIYAGLPVQGMARDVFINGLPVIRNGELVSHGQGKYLHRMRGEHYRQQ